MNDVLRVAMVQVGETADSLAAKVGVDPKSAARWVSRGSVPHPGTRVAVAQILGRGVGELWPETLLRRGPIWFRPWADNEREATSLRSFEMNIVPGLLQTRAYASALFRGGALLTDDEVDERVELRLERQALLTGENPPMFTAVFDESVLRRPVGGPAVMREQLLHLLAMAESPRVRLHVVPWTVGAYPGLAGPFVLATLPGGQGLSYLDNHLEGQVVEKVGDLETLQRIWESVRSEALPHQQTVELIREVAETWI
ncbi:hypothetical protein BDK92_3060 [Micromonospora pisi]|uniref:DUF5753 domain-containing protein n=1 Tax=Micromonospora pisi TaxID=589240 RepID=A0A495JI55_9ACTN|nr:DUF5753 domain-containing protein [Micromonospora pisi]RKR88730.1 hypothetical protein BDK92_3060 [Micromonospora pisi]